MLTPKWNAGLIGPHLEMAAYDGTDYLRVKAGPGTGKTYALMRRVTRLLEEGVDPKTILAVSFTRTAAQDLITKLQELDAPGAELVNACTLHSLAFRILNKKAVFEALNRNSRPMMDFEVECLIADLAYSFDGIDKTRDLLESFESYWATLQSEDPNPSDDPTEQRFEIALERWLRYHQSMLIGEVVVLALRYLKTNPAAAEALGYAHVLVDEYQDLNRADQELIEILASDGALTAIGDEDQSIYSFRHAHPEAITGFDDVHPETHDVELLECRRCPKKVLKMANALILHNERGNDAILLPFATNPEGDVHIVQHESDSHEVSLTAAYIKWYLAENPDVNPGEVLILSPRKQSGYALRNMLNGTGVPAQSFFAEDCLNTEIAKQGFSILSLLVDPNDRTALRAWLGIDRPDKRVAPYRSLVAEAKAAGISPKEFLDLVLAEEAKAPRYCTELIERYKLLLGHLDTCSKLTPSQIVDHCWPDRNEECESVRTIALDALIDGDEVSTFREKTCS
ncbi:ATP-dependent helicase [Hymenobacter algoricola]|uniref:DNA 3'-5' helicase II n=1 Tax=Hymenobacter algoricola TaxID=486267 RepID=A0ABP7NAK1_9BACT